MCVFVSVRNQTDMIMRVRVVLLLQGLLLAARCDVRARDPELEEEHESKDMPQHGGRHHDIFQRTGYLGTSHQRREPHRQSPDASGTAFYPSDYGHINPSFEQPSQGFSDDMEDVKAETSNQNPLQYTGNWCAFVHKRAVTMAVACGTEKYIVKSQSPCPNGSPDCQLVMYKLATRPVYREKQKIFSALLWRCCPGHRGRNCEELDEDGLEPEDTSTAGSIQPGGSERQNTGFERLAPDQIQEQNDHQDANSPSYEALSSRENQTEDNYDNPHTQHVGVESSGAEHEHRSSPPETAYPDPRLLHFIKETVMSQLQPVLDNFNLTLKRLSAEVQSLQEDMTQLQLQQESESENGALEHGGAAEELQQHKDKLTDSFQQLADLKKELSLQRQELDNKLHAQQTMLYYNLTQFKTDVDVKIKRNQKTLQTSLHALNSSLAEVIQDQKRLDEEISGVWTPARPIPTPAKPQEDTAVWEAIRRLDSKVVNDSINLSALNEYQIQMYENIGDLQRSWKTLDEKITQTDRKSEDRYIEMVLEVDGAKVAVESNVNQVATNITSIQAMMQEIEVDVDYLYTVYYKNMSSRGGDCECKALSKSIAQLKQAVDNVTTLAHENRLALDNAAEERLRSWEDDSWGSSVDELKAILVHVQDSLAFEQEKGRTLQQNVSMLQTSISSNKVDIEALQKQDKVKASEIVRLYDSFTSLLKDAIRHSDVLEVLLGEELLEFMDWAPEDKEAHSIPNLKVGIREMQQQINRHSQILTSMVNYAKPGETPADEPSSPEDWAVSHLEQSPVTPTYYTYNDFSALKKAVEQLGAQVFKHEQKQCDCSKGAASGALEEKLQTELNAVRESLEDHLRIFNSIFSNTEGLAGSNARLDVNKLFALMKRKESKQQRREKKRGPQTREHANLRRKRDASLETAVLSPESPLMFLASSRDGVNTSGTVVFETVSLNRGQMYSPKTGVFQAPTGGVYLFVLTLDFGPGPSLARLKRGGEVAASLHQSQRKPAGPATRVCLLQLEQDEELQLEIVQGTLEPNNPQDNTFAGLLLLQTT